jgi:hypothetical protein
MVVASSFLSTAYSNVQQSVLFLAVLLLALNYVSSETIEKLLSHFEATPTTRKEEESTTGTTTNESLNEIPNPFAQYEALDSPETTAFVQDQVNRVDEYLSVPATNDLVKKVQWNADCRATQNNVEQSKVKQSNAKQSKAKQSKAKQNKQRSARQSRAEQSRAERSRAVQSSAEQVQSSAEQCRAVQISAEQSKAKQSRAKQRKAKQSNAKQSKAE